MKQLPIQPRYWPAQDESDEFWWVAYCHNLDVDEQHRDVIEHLNRGTAKPSELLPDLWNASHPEAVRAYREVERRYKAELYRFSLRCENGVSISSVMKVV